MGIIGSAKLFQALSRDKLLPGLSVFGRGTKSGDEPIFAIFLTYSIAQVALFADLNQIATLISMGYQVSVEMQPPYSVSYTRQLTSGKKR
jgi:potassium/chloride transporter 9